MSIENVVQAYEEMQNLSDAPLTYIAVACWFVIGIMIIIHMIKDRKSLSIGAISMNTLSLAVTGFIVFHLYMNITEYDFSLDEEKWKQDYLLPYLESQPVQSLTIEHVQATNTTSDQAISSIHLQNNSPTVHVEFTAVQKDKRKQDMSTKVRIKQAPDNTAPYITYKAIESDISDSYTDDMYYDTTLYINQESRLYH